MRDRLRAFWRGYKRGIRGECRWEGCTEPRERWFDFCPKHLQEDWRRFRKAREEREFERDVAVTAAALERVLQGDKGGSK